MEESTVSFQQLAATSNRFAVQLLNFSENRLELLAVEVQEEREHLLHAFLLALGVAAFGMLAGITLTGVIVVGLWASAPVAALVTLTWLYGATAVWLSRRLTGFLRDWQTFSSSLEQLRKDRACLEKLIP